jgi:hypothetical protein
MSKFYQVRSAQTVYSKVTVEANSEDEAKQLAIEGMEWRDYDADGFEITSITEEMRDD